MYRDKEKRREYNKKYYLKNKKRILKQKKEYCLKNRYIVSKYKKEYCLKNRDKISKLNKEYRLKNRDKIMVYNKKYYYNNRDKILKQKKEYCLKNRHKRSKWGKEYHLKNRDKILKKLKEYFSNNKNKFANNAKIYRKNIKLQVLKKYTKLYYNIEPFCNCCGEYNINCLTIDHVYGCGNKHRREINKDGSGGKMYTWLKQNNYPNGFQVLCASCNLAKSTNKECPHKQQIRDILGLALDENGKLIKKNNINKEHYSLYEELNLIKIK